MRPGTHTLYEGIRRLEPGGALLLDRHGTRMKRYWTPRFQEPLERGEVELARETRAVLDLAVRRRLDSQGTTGLLLSGGLDSASVAAIAASHGSARLHAYSGVFPEHPAVDESVLIGNLTRTLGLPETVAEVRAGGPAGKRARIPGDLAGTAARLGRLLDAAADAGGQRGRRAGAARRRRGR